VSAPGCVGALSRGRARRARASIHAGHPAAGQRERDNPMKNLRSVLALAAAALSLSIQAAPAKEASATAAAPGMTQQQSKMATCNTEAADKKGDERKTFMKQCLSAKPASQQDKMKTCNKEAAGKKGDERKAFMKECLSA
jgi:hypothetical protein